MNDNQKELNRKLDKVLYLLKYKNNEKLNNIKRGDVFKVVSELNEDPYIFFISRCIEDTGNSKWGIIDLTVGDIELCKSKFEVAESLDFWKGLDYLGNFDSIEGYYNAEKIK